MPVPGPPVISDSRCRNALAHAARAAPSVSCGARRRSAALACAGVRRTGPLTSPRTRSASSASSAAVSRPVDPCRPSRTRSPRCDQLVELVRGDRRVEQLRRARQQCAHAAGRCCRCAPPRRARAVRRRGSAPTASTGRPTRAGDPVGDQEADAEHARQLVRVLAHDPVRGRPVVLADPLDQVAEPVRREQQVQLAGHAQRVPRCRRLRRPARPPSPTAANAALGSRSIASSTPRCRTGRQPLGALARRRA